MGLFKFIFFTLVLGVSDVTSSLMRNQDEEVINSRRLQESNQQQEEPVNQSGRFEGYPEGGPVIALLVASRPQDIDEACLALRSLVFLKGDNPNFPAPVLLFNEGDLSREQVNALRQSTNRPVAFPLVDFSNENFPKGWNHQIETKMFRVKDRNNWGYYHMIRFWVTGIWQHPALGPYETVMRIDSDSCFKEVNAHLPNLKNPSLVYHSQYVGYEDGKDFTRGLIDFTENFLKEIKRFPGNPFMWDFIQATWKTHGTLPVFNTNFEVSRKSFMLRPDVVAWHNALTEKEPYGVFRYRWGDAVTRFLTMALFTTNEKVMTSRPIGYGHKTHCAKNEVEAAISTITE